MTVFHPRKNDKGLPVEIKHPSRASDLSNWADASLPAVATPDCAIPPSINGVPTSHVVPPVDTAGWERLVVESTVLTAPPLANPSKKKLSAGTLIVEPDGRVWLFEPTNAYGGYVRTFPKGTVEPGYSLAATAAKETFEETGLLVEIGRPIADAERTTSVSRYFLARRIGGTPADMGWEAQAVCLVPLALLPKMAPAPADKPVLAALAGLTWPA